jgi:nucleotide-binding universal stress UspA family protein
MLEKIRPAQTDVVCQHHLLVGEPAEEIVQLACEHEIDLIVIGTHGRTGLSRWILGSVAESILRRAICPVLTCRQSAEKVSVQPMDPRISFAT